MSNFPMTLYSVSFSWSRVRFSKQNLEKYGKLGYFRYFIQNPLRAEDSINSLCEMEVLAKTKSTKLQKTNDKGHSENYA